MFLCTYSNIHMFMVIYEIIRRIWNYLNILKKKLSSNSKYFSYISMKQNGWKKSGPVRWRGPVRWHHWTLVYVFCRFKLCFGENKQLHRDLGKNLTLWKYFQKFPKLKIRQDTMVSKFSKTCNFENLRMVIFQSWQNFKFLKIL